MNFQEQRQEKLENTQYEYAENANKAIAFNDPITNMLVVLQGSAHMKMSMDEYAKLRVPEGVAYNIADTKDAPDEPLPLFDSTRVANESLNMFYRYLNAL